MYSENGRLNSARVGVRCAQRLSFFRLDGSSVSDESVVVASEASECLTWRRFCPLCPFCRFCPRVLAAPPPLSSVDVGDVA